MKQMIFIFMLSIIMSGCGRESLPCGDGGISLNSGISEDKGILVLNGIVAFRNAADGVREIVMQVKNNTKNGLWVPSSDGGRGQIDCEAVNLSVVEQDGFPRRGLHSDHGLCQFPDMYTRLKPGGSCVYVYKMPDDFSGNIKFSVWTPWRTEKGDMIDMKTKNAALKDSNSWITPNTEEAELIEWKAKKASLKNGDQLIEKVEGIGILK